MGRVRHLILLFWLGALAPTTAAASQTADLSVRFLPNRLGHGTSIEFGVRISATNGGVPAPLSELDMRYPSSLGFAVSGLGLATCSRARLETLGPASCPANSHMGRGSVIVAIPIGPEVVKERAPVTILRAPHEGDIALWFFAVGEEPVSAEIAFSGLLAGAATTGGERILVNVPLVQGLPEGPDVAVTGLHATFGPLGLTYYERVRGEVVPYTPRGILLPKKCPRDGFRFSAYFSFLDGSRASARATVPCPQQRRR